MVGASGDCGKPDDIQTVGMGRSGSVTGVAGAGSKYLWREVEAL